ncbi:MAG: hypothetical protein ABH857_01040 [Elusimicrobiota bacterium]
MMISRKSKPYAIMLFSALVLAGCSVKERLANSTVEVRITPSGNNVYVGENILQLTVDISNANHDKVAAVPVWSIEENTDSSTAYGTITQDGLYTTPASLAAKPLTATVRVDVQGAIGTAKVNIVNTELSGASQSFYFYSELKQDVTYGVGKDAIMGTSSSPVFGADTNYAYEGEESLKTVTSGLANWYISFNALKDLSAFSGGNLKFAVKTTDNITIKLGWGAGPTFGVKTLSNFETVPGEYRDNKWHEVSVSLSSFSGINLTKFSQIVFEGTNAEYYIDNVYFEK